MASAQLTTSRIAFSLAALARRMARKATPSQRIQESMEINVLGFGIVAVEVPYYWARFYHDGRGRVEAKAGHKIVFFKNPDDDPRINGAARNYPKRAASIRRLSKKQFYQFLSEGKLVAVDSVKSADAHPFFTEGLRTLKSNTRRAGAPGLFSQHVVAEMGPLLNFSRSGKIRIR